MVYKTQSSFYAKDRGQDWVQIDATGKTLGRLSSEVAFILLGKHKVGYTPGVVTGDHVVVTGVEGMLSTGNKKENKLYHRHSRFSGGLKTISLKQVLNEKPERAVEWAVSKMLPRNKLRKQLMSRLKIYPGAQHPHQAQKPVKIENVRGKAL